MIEVDIPQETIQKAEQKSLEMGHLNNSITKGKGNVAGFIGELLVSNLTGWEVSNTYDYDLITGLGEKIDVKTKRTNYPPKDYYDCSIAAYNTRQKCDKYVFVRVKNDLSKAWILGQKQKEEYFAEARFLKKGDKDGDNKFTVKSDCYNLPIKDLDSLETSYDYRDPDCYSLD